MYGSGGAATRATEDASLEGVTSIEGGGAGRQHLSEPVTGFVQSSHVVLEETSAAACALASHDGWLHLAWTGSDGRLNVMTSADGVSFGGKATLRHRSSRTESSGEHSRTVLLAPALVATPRGVFIGWTGTDRQLNVLLLGRPDDSNAIIPERSPHGPALTTRGGDLVLAWTGSDRRLNVIHAYEGGFSAPLTLDHTTWGTPGLVAWGDDQLLAWAGTDRQLNLLPLSSAPYGHPTFPGCQTDRTPTLCTVGDHLVVAWRDVDRHLYVRTAPRGGRWGLPINLPMTSSHGPAICCHRNNLALAWTGTDRRLNVAQLRAT